jgi:hypothetical protein
LSLGQSEKKRIKDGAKCGKESRWMRRSRMIDQQGRRIMDKSVRGKTTIGFFGAPHEKEGKTGWRIPENMGQVDLGF